MTGKFDEFQTLFPEGTVIIDVKGTVDAFESSLRVASKNKENFKTWLQEFQEKSKLTFRVQWTKPTTGTTVLYKAGFRCHHNTYPKSHSRVKAAHPKHTGCPAVMKVTIKSSVENRRVRSADKLRAEFPTIIRYSHNHNHEVDVAAALRHRDLNSNTREKLINLFRNRHTPRSALQLHKQDLIMEYEDDFSKISADASICPDMQAMYRLYASWHKNEFVALTPLKEYADCIIEKKESSTKVLYKLLGEEDFVIAALPSFMERAHEIESSGEMVFISSGSNIARFNCEVFLLFCDSTAGGLPLGFFLTTSVTENTIALGLELLQQLLPQSAFGGNKAPAIFITNDCQLQVNAFKRMFPMSNVLLCTFHILQSVWRWLLNPIHKIDLKDRQYLFGLFKNLIYSKDENYYLEERHKMLRDATVLRYQNYYGYINNILLGESMWAQCFRVMDRDQNTNDIVKNAMKVMKDSILYRTRAYNPVQLFKFLETHFCNYYSRKIVDIINGKVSCNEYSKLNKMDELDIKEKLDNGHIVIFNKSTKNEYDVDIKAGLCACPLGKSGAPCRHQYFATLKLKQTSENIISMDCSTRTLFHWVAYGIKVPKDFYSNLESPVRIDFNLENSPETNEQSKTVILASEESNTEKTVWPELKTRWIALFEKWENQNSTLQSTAIGKAVTYLESCLTESASVSALYNISNTVGSRKYTTSISVQPTSVAGRKDRISTRRKAQSVRPPKSNRKDHTYV